MVFGIIQRVAGRALRTIRAIYYNLQVRICSKHLSGPSEIRLKDDDVALVCMLRNGSYYVDVILEHHRSMGIKHFLFIDNGSEDDTVVKLAREANVTVVSNRLPVNKYECILRANVARRLVKGGWLLFLDSDELIEMPHGVGRDIREYTNYCNERNYDALVTQCLDLFAARPLSEIEKWSYRRSISEFNRYSLCCITNFDYHDEAVGFAWFLRSNTVSNSDIKIKFGGMRRALFGEDCALTSHRMVRNLKHIELYTHPHASGNVRCGDFSILLRHYKFAGNYLARERRQVRDGTWAHGEDKLRLAVVDSRGFCIPSQQVQRFEGTGRLLEQGFLAASDDFHTCFPPTGQTLSKD